MSDIEDTLRHLIASDDRTHYGLAKAAGITPDILDRFATGERGMTLATAAKLATVLGLELVQRRNPKRGRRTASL